MYDASQTKIKSTYEIIHLLKNIQKSKQLISLSFKSLPNLCLTSLLEIQEEKKQILIFDEPNPAINLKRNNLKEDVECSLKLNKLPVTFKTKIITNKRKNRTSEIYTQLPKEIYYPQNRSYYRFRTEFIEDIFTTIFISPTLRLPSQLINISLNGLCLRLPYSYASKFRLQQILEDVYIELPKQNGFSISAKVKDIRIENNYNNIALGLEIHQQKSRIERSIQQFIFRTESSTVNTNISL